MRRPTYKYHLWRQELKFREHGTGYRVTTGHQLRTVQMQLKTFLFGIN